MNEPPDMVKSRDGDQPTSGLAAVAFFHLPGMYAQDASIAFCAIQELHDRLRAVGFPQGSLMMSAFTGAIVVVRDGVFDHAEKSQYYAIHHYFGGLCSEFAERGIPVRIGVAYGYVEYFDDIVGGTYIGAAVNLAARIACFKTNSGLLYHASYLKHVMDDPDHDKHRPDPNKPEDAKGKEHDDNKGFSCFLPMELPPMVKRYLPAKIPTHSPVKIIDAFIVAVDLPKFSSGDMDLLSKRFRGFRDAGRKALLEHGVDKLYYSPGGDGGVFTFRDVAPGFDARGILDRLGRELKKETRLHVPEAAVQTRMGADYGRVSIYMNAQGNLVPTGHRCYVADQIAYDITDGSIACTMGLGQKGGADFKPEGQPPPLDPIELSSHREIPRYLLRGNLKPEFRQQTVELTINGDVNSGSDSDRERLLDSIRNLYSFKCKVREVHSQRGSDKLLIRLPAFAADALVKGIEEGALAPLNVTSAVHLGPKGTKDAAASLVALPHSEAAEENSLDQSDVSEVGPDVKSHHIETRDESLEDKPAEEEDGATDYNAWLETAAKMFCGGFLAMRPEIQKRVADAIGFKPTTDRRKLEAAVRKRFAKSVPQDENDTAWFDRTLVNLDAIEAVPGVSPEDIERVRAAQNIVFQLGFPSECLVRLANQLRPGGALVIQNSVATQVLAELSTAFVNQAPPNFIRSDHLGVQGEGLLHYVPPPLDDSRVDVLVLNLLKDLAAQLSVSLNPEKPGMDVRETMRYWADQLNRAMTMYSNLWRSKFGKGIKKPGCSCRFYCVIEPPPTDSQRQRLVQLLEIVNKNVHDLAFFILQRTATSKETEEIVLQILKDRFNERRIAKA